MMWKPYVISGIVFGVAYAISRDYFFAGVNGFGAFYVMYYLEKKSDRENANMEVGL